MYATLAHRYEQYKRHLVRGFYKEHFSGFDRQIVLVDCLQALDAGPGGFEDMRQAIGRIMQSFSYGKSSWWRRLFVPRIDRLLFVASKADHVTPDQHYNMVSLLQHIVQSARGQARFEGVTTDCLAIAAVRATEAGVGRHGGAQLPGIRGHGIDGEPLFVAPGAGAAGAAAACVVARARGHLRCFPADAHGARACDAAHPPRRRAGVPARRQDGVNPVPVKEG